MYQLEWKIHLLFLKPDSKVMTSDNICDMAKTFGHAISTNIYSHKLRAEKISLNPLNRFLLTGSCAVHLEALGQT